MRPEFQSHSLAAFVSDFQKGRVVWQLCSRVSAAGGWWNLRLLVSKVLLDRPMAGLGAECSSWWSLKPWGSSYPKLPRMPSNRKIAKTYITRQPLELHLRGSSLGPPETLLNQRGHVEQRRVGLRSSCWNWELYILMW